MDQIIEIDGEHMVINENIVRNILFAWECAVLTMSGFRRVILSKKRK